MTAPDHIIAWFCIAAVTETDWTAKAAFVGVFVLLIVLLAMIPPRLLGQSERNVPFWRNVRWWAMAIAAAQVIIYAWLG